MRPFLRTNRVDMNLVFIFNINSFVNYIFNRNKTKNNMIIAVKKEIWGAGGLVSNQSKIKKRYG